MIHLIKKSFPKFLYLCKVFATATLLLLGNPSEGIDMPGNFIFFSNADLSPNMIFDLNHESHLTQDTMDEMTNLRKYSVKRPEK